MLHQRGEVRYGDNIETKWARWSVNIPYNKEDALKLSGFIAELVEEAVTAESGTE